MLAELLSTCGLNKTEQKLFTSLYSDGPSNASLLAKRLGLKRPTIYAGLANLTERGIITAQKKKGSTIFALVDPSLIPAIIRTRAEDELGGVIDAAARLPLFLAEIDRRQKLSFGDFEVIVLESIEAIFAQLGQIYDGKGFSAVVNPQLAFVGKAKELTKRFLELSAKRQPEVKEVIVAGPVADWYKRSIKNRRHAVRELPASSAVQSDIIIADRSVFILHYQGRRELGLKIRHGGFHDTAQELFNRIFESLPPPAKR